MVTGIVEFMVNQNIPATQKFVTRKELDFLVRGGLAPVVVTVLPEGEKGTLWERYSEIANLARDTPLHFWYTSDVSLSKGLGLSPDESVVIMRPPR